MMSVERNLDFDWVYVKDLPVSIDHLPSLRPSPPLGNLILCIIQQAAEYWDPVLWMLMQFSISMEPKPDIVFL